MRTVIPPQAQPSAPIVQPGNAQEVPMQRIVIREFGGPEQLLVEGAEDLAPAPGQVLVGVEAAGVNFLDINQRSGQSRVHAIALPHVLGLEGVGRIRALGEGIDRIAPGLTVGARVAWMDVGGSYASQVLVPASRAVLIPDRFPVSQGLLFQALTAQYLVHEYRDIQAGDRVLVHAAASGLGQILVQWLKHRGAWVVGTVSSEAKAAVVRARGADAVAIYGSDYDFVDQIMTFTDSEGVDLAFDGLGEKTLINTLSVLRRGGTVVAIGAASGPIPSIQPTLLTQKALRLTGGSVFTYVADPIELQQRSRQVIAAIDEGWLRLDDAKAYPLAEAVQAHRDIEQRHALGKLYLAP